MAVAPGVALTACLVLLGLGIQTAGAITPGAPALPEGWVTQLDRDHVLVGTIWSTAAGRRAAPEELARALVASPVALLGEVHDNADHHRLQAWAVEQLAAERRITAAKPAPAVAFEHIRADQQSVLDEFLASAPREASGRAESLLARLNWQDSGWPPAAIFVPLFDAALRLGLPLLAGDPPAGNIRTVARQGFSALPAGEARRLGLDAPLDAPLAGALVAELERSHCGMLPKSALPGIAAAQRYRDAHLADIVLTGLDRYGSVALATGNGHARADRGVAWYLRRRAGEVGVVSVALVEVDASADPETYVPRDPDGRPAVDFLWFTPRAERPDPCAEMRVPREGGKQG